MAYSARGRPVSGMSASPSVQLPTSEPSSVPQWLSHSSATTPSPKVVGTTTTSSHHHHSPQPASDSPHQPRYDRAAWNAGEGAGAATSGADVPRGAPAAAGYRTETRDPVPSRTEWAPKVTVGTGDIRADSANSTAAPNSATSSTHRNEYTASTSSYPQIGRGENVPPPPRVSSDYSLRSPPSDPSVALSGGVGGPHTSSSHAWGQSSNLSSADAVTATRASGVRVTDRYPLPPAATTTPLSSSRPPPPSSVPGRWHESALHFGTPASRLPPAAAAAAADALPQRWASHGTPRLHGSDGIKARLDALTAGGTASVVHGGTTPPIDGAGVMSRRVTELERERADLLGKQAEQLKVVRECLAERAELKRADAEQKASRERFEQELMAMVEKLTGAQTGWRESLDAKSVECDELRKESTSLTKQIQDEQERTRAALTAQAEWQQRAESTATQLSTATVDLNAERARLQAADTRGKSETARCEKQLAALQRTRSAELERAEDVATELKTTKCELQDAMHKIEEHKSLLSDAALQASRIEKAHAEAMRKAKAEAERAADSRDAADHEHARAEVDRLKDSHRTEVTRLTERHRAELAEHERTKSEQIDEATARLFEERDRHGLERDELQGKLNQAQTKLQALQAALKSRDALDSEQITKLGGELESVLKQQYDSVARVATQLRAASETLSEGSRSIVQDTLELQDVASISTHLHSQSLGAGLVGGTHDNAQPSYRARPFGDGQYRPPARSPMASSLLGDDFTSPRHSSTQIGAPRTQTPFRHTVTTDEELVQRAMSNLGSSSRWLDTSNSGSKLNVESHGSPATRSGGTALPLELPGGFEYDRSFAVRDAMGTHQHPTPTGSSAVRHEYGNGYSPRPSDVSASRKAPGDRNYEKPWLVGIRKKPSIGKQAVNEVYRLLQESRDTKMLPSSPHQPHESPDRAHKRVWK